MPRKSKETYLNEIQDSLTYLAKKSSEDFAGLNVKYLADISKALQCMVKILENSDTVTIMNMPVDIQYDWSDKNAQKKRIQTYLAKALEQYTGKKPDKKAMDFLFANAPADALIEMGNRLPDNRKAIGIKKGAKPIALPGPDTKMLDTFQQILDSYKGYDFDRLERKEIGGNTFLYEKGVFPIEDHIAELEEFSKGHSGQTYCVSLSEDGELVIY